jgi:CO/xanthine dehydrogenase Mo-binding subunit
MDGNIEIDQLALTKFGIGQPVPRNEDPMLVCGQGRYTDDINLPADSDELIAGGGTGGSKSLMASGTAIVGASEKVIERGRQIAAHVLEAAVADVEFSRGRF